MTSLNDQPDGTNPPLSASQCPLLNIPIFWRGFYGASYFFLLVCSPAFPVQASPGVITTIAGNNGSGSTGDGGAATSAYLSSPRGMAVDSAGNCYFADYNNHRVRKVNTAGIITTVAGTGTSGFSGDGGQATNAQLYYPLGVALDGNGNLYIADSYNHRIRKVSTTGIITTVAGTGGPGYGGDWGAATSANLKYPSGVAVDGAGNLFIADSSNNCIRKVNSNGIINTYAGTGIGGFSGDGGVATSATFLSISALCLDKVGNLYIVDSGNKRIRKVDSSGIVSTVAGNGVNGFNGDGGLATSASLAYPQSIVLDGAGDLFIADQYNSRIRMANTGGIISTVAGNGTQGYSGDGGPATTAQLSAPYGVALDSAGNLLIGDMLNNRIRKVESPFSSALSINNVAGNEGSSGSTTFTFTVTRGGDMTSAVTFNYSTTDGTATAGDDYVATSGTATIAAGAASTTIGVTVNADSTPEQDEFFTVTLNNPSSGSLVNATGTGTILDGAVPIISTYGGTGSRGSTGDGGPAWAASFSYPTDIAFDPAGNLYIADTYNNRVRKVNPSGIITAVAGTGISGYSGDGGAATAAQLNFPSGIVLDGAGNLYIADCYNQRIRKVDSNGVITTIVGMGSAGNIGDGGAATAARLNNPSDVALDGAGNLYIADAANSCIRKVDTSGIISTYGEAILGYPQGLAFDPAGNLYIADTSGNRIRKVSPSGTLTTVAGNGNMGFGGDGGPATSANLSSPYNLTFDAAGNLYFADTSNHRIRKVNANGIITTVVGRGIQGYGGDGGAATDAKLQYPCGVAFNSAGYLFIADQYNQRIRTLAPLLSINDVSTNEGDSGTKDITFTVTRGGDKTNAVTFNYSTADGTATAGEDYVAASGIATIVAGATSTTIAVTVNGDTTPEPAETFALNLSNASEGILTKSSGLAVIVNDETDSTQKYVSTYVGNGTKGFGGDGGFGARPN